MRYRLTKNQVGMLLAGKPLRLLHTSVAIDPTNKETVNVLRTYLRSKEFMEKYEIFYDAEQQGLMVEKKGE